MLTLPIVIAERSIGDGEIRAPALVSILAKLKPNLHSNVRKGTFIPPWESLEQDVLEYLSLCYHRTDLKKEEVHMSEHVLPVGNVWRWFQFQAAEKATQLLNRFKKTRTRIISEWETCGQVTNYST